MILAVVTQQNTYMDAANEDGHFLNDSLSLPLSKLSRNVPVNPVKIAVSKIAIEVNEYFIGQSPIIGVVLLCLKDLDKLKFLLPRLSTERLFRHCKILKSIYQSQTVLNRQR